MMPSQLQTMCGRHCQVGGSVTGGEVLLRNIGLFFFLHKEAAEPGVLMQKTLVVTTC